MNKKPTLKEKLSGIDHDLEILEQRIDRIIYRPRTLQKMLRTLLRRDLWEFLSFLSQVIIAATLIKLAWI